MKYAELYNNKIIKIHNSLPESWNNISNLFALSNEELSDLSWSGNDGYKFFPLIEEQAPDIDRRFYNIQGPNHTIDENNKVVYQSYMVVAKSNEEVWKIIRSQRNNKLSNTDWTQLPDVQLTSQEKEVYKIYRQSLRDITTQNDPFNIIWPEFNGQ